MNNGLVISNFNTGPYFKDVLKKDENTKNIEIINIYNNICFLNELKLNRYDFIYVFLIPSLYFELEFNEIIVKGDLIINYYKELCRNIYCVVSKKTSLIYWVGFDFSSHYSSLIYSDFFVIEKKFQEINDMIVKDFIGCKFINLTQIITKIGKDRALNRKNFYRFNNPFSFDVYSEIALLQDKFNYKKKYIILDCDNVLWKGVLSEKTEILYENADFSRIHFLFRKLIVELYNRGIILFIVSKNNIIDIQKMLQKADLDLKKDMFLDLICNYNDKAKNIEYLIKKYNLDDECILFIDDDPFEIKNVNISLPKISSLLFDDFIIEKLSSFFIFNSNEYVDIDLRFKSYKKLGEINEFYSKETKGYVSIIESREGDTFRILQLSQRSKRFNNGTMGKVPEYLYDNFYITYVVFFKCLDIDFGLIGFIVIEKSKLIVKSICISCRAIGFNVIDEIKKFLIRENIKKIDYIQNSENEMFINIILTQLIV